MNRYTLSLKGSFDRRRFNVCLQSQFSQGIKFQFQNQGIPLSGTVNEVGILDWIICITVKWNAGFVLRRLLVVDWTLTPKKKIIKKKLKNAGFLASCFTAFQFLTIKTFHSFDEKFWDRNNSYDRCRRQHTFTWSMAYAPVVNFRIQVSVEQ